MQNKRVTCFLGLGTNLGDKTNNLKRAILAIENAGIQVIEKSRVYKTPPWGFDATEDFYNMVVKAETALQPFQLLVELKALELKMGRKPKETEHYTSRVIDIDIIDYNQIIFDEHDLKIPHPHLEKRIFVLLPLKDVFAGYKHPASFISIDEMIKTLNDEDITLVNNLP